jgi:hypothetical protein
MLSSVYYIWIYFVDVGSKRVVFEFRREYQFSTFHVSELYMPVHSTNSVN